MSRKVLSVAVVVMLLVPGVALVASADTEDQVYTGCLTKKGELLRVAIGDEPAKPCWRGHEQISWSEEGPEGPRGRRGRAGADAELDFVPTTERVDDGTVPSIPVGLKTSCGISPDDVPGDGTCPVLHWNGVTYWAFSFTDNRVAMEIVGFSDVSGEIVSSTYKTGARYVYNITVDPGTQVITFSGQADNTVTMTYTVPWLLAP